MEEVEVTAVEPEVIEVETAGQELEETTVPETDEVKESEQVEEKTFTQGELEAEIGKRLAREKRKFERAQATAVDIPPLQLDSKINPNAYTTTEDYLEALATERAEAIVAHRDRSKSVNEIERKYQDQIDESVDKYPDFVQVAHTHRFMTNEMASAIKSSDIAADLAYHLGSNLKEAERIFNLSPMMQIKELGKLEAKLEASPPSVKKVSSAPAPIRPVTGSKTQTPTYDTTDPRSAGKMSASEWIAADRARRAKQMAAKGYK